MKKPLVICILSVAAAGCQTPGSMAPSQTEAANMTTTSLLSRYAETASLALRDLAETDMAVARRGSLPAAEPLHQTAAPLKSNPEMRAESAIPPGYESLSHRVNFAYTGDIEDLVRRLVAHIPSREGWRYIPPTRSLAVPLTVTISARDKTVFDVLQEVGAQAGLSADIRVNANSRQITIVYAVGAKQ